MSVQVSDKRGVSMRLVLGLTVLTGLVIAAIITGVYFAPVTAPNVVGMSVPDAAATLTDARIRIDVAGKMASSPTSRPSPASVGAEETTSSSPTRTTPAPTPLASQTPDSNRRHP